jgi:hypothetical protein
MASTQCNQCWQYLVEPPDRHRQPCPRCGGLGRHFSETVTVEAKLRIQARFKQRRPGWKRPIFESKSGDDFHVASGEWRKFSRAIDREHDRYTEYITDAAGNVVRDVDQPLSEHRGQGSARRRRPKNPSADG